MKTLYKDKKVLEHLNPIGEFADTYFLQNILQEQRKIYVFRIG